MKHIFVINPKAGKEDRTKEIRTALSNRQSPLDFEIYVTKERGDAQGFVHDYLESHPGLPCRFYAVGGDGTLYDVANGMRGFPEAELACLAMGSGNDFVKNFHDIEAFRDLEKAISARARSLDVLIVNGRRCLNIANFGFDGEVTAAQRRYKKWPFVSGPMAYNLAAFTSLLFKMNRNLKVRVDDKLLFEGKGLLAIAANGFCYGGGFHCAPKAKIDDGLLDVAVIKSVRRLKAAAFMKIFKSGEYLESPKTKDLALYVQGHKATFESEKLTAYALDGEVFFDKRLDISLEPSSLRFAVPEGE